MILPIAHCLIDEDIWSNQSAINKIEYWYWSSIFSGHYRESQNSRSIEDISFLLEWIKGDSDNQFEPRENGIFESSVYSDESMLLRDLENVEQYPVPTAIHESILQYVLSCQPVDFLPKDDYGDLPRLK